MGNIDLEQILVDSFLGYKFRKYRGMLYSMDANVPINLIRLYYSEDIERANFDSLKKSFVNRYIKSESKLEDIHEQLEIEGLAEMYEYIHEIPSDEFEMFSIMQLHRKLYSKCPYPEAGGQIRQRNVYLPGTGTETCDYSFIFDEFMKHEDTVKQLMQVAKEMRTSGDYSQIFNFVRECIILKCALIKIHPFEDGNGRTVRCFINRIFEEAGIPPVYIKVNERTEYHNAMNKANNEGDFDQITGFYLYKICDSIIELDINERLKIEREERKQAEQQQRNNNSNNNSILERIDSPLMKSLRFNQINKNLNKKDGDNA